MVTGYTEPRMALLSVGLFGLATLSEASTTTMSPTNSTNVTDVVVVPVPFYQLDDQIKPVLTIGAMAVFIIIGFIVAKFVDRWHDRKEPSENASDCSLTTRQLLKQRVALQAFQDLTEKEREAFEAAQDEEDDGISEAITGHKSSGDPQEIGGAEGGKELMKGEGATATKAGKLWMFKTAFMGKKRERDPETAAAEPESAKPKEEAKEQKIFTLPQPGKDAKGDQNTNPKTKEFIDVQFTHHRVEESFTISKRMSNQPDTPDGENPYMYKYRHVSEDVRIPVRMMSPEAAAAAKHAADRKDMAHMGYYAELALAPTRLGHYADSDFGSTASLEQNKTNNNHDTVFKAEDENDTMGKAPNREINRRNSPSPTKVHFSSSESPTKATPADSDGLYDDDFESISTNDHHESTKRIRTGKTDKTEYSYASGPTIGNSLPSVGTVNTKTSEETPHDDGGMTSARRQVKENAAATAAGTRGKEKVEKPAQFSRSSTKDKGKAKKIVVQPRI